VRKTLIVGESSFIGKHLSNFDIVSYNNFKYADICKYRTVVNCALNPSYKLDKYDERCDVDFEIGKKAFENNCHFVMLSTSKIYGNSFSLKIYDENSEFLPYDFYSENKLITEDRLLYNFGNKITILRGSNIFGYEYGRNSFLGFCMNQLVDTGIIKYVVSEKIKRDFLFVDDAAFIIEKVCEEKPIGVYNLSSNYGLEIGSIARSLIDGYSYGGKFESDNTKLDRQFILDNSKLKNCLKMNIGPFDYTKIFKNLGEQLCKI
jgi:nucleoside-diphosphate-sugar epimerase